MALKKPKPKTLSQDELKGILDASAQQTGKRSKVVSYDPNFPAFDIPINTKVLAYVPNHTVQNPDGSMGLLMDKFAAHNCVLRKEYVKVRCTGDIVSDTLGLDGTCPFCDATAEAWELANKEFAAVATAAGLDPNEETTRKTLKSDWDNIKKRMAIQGGMTYVTFPIVVIDCVKKDGKLTTTPKKNAEGHITGKVMWYSVSEKTYNDKWVKALETAPSVDEVPPTSPAGLWAVLNYEYDSPDGKHDKMTSAQKLAVGYKSMPPALDAYAAQFDSMTEEWTPEKAMETLVANVLRDGQEQQEACDEIMKSTRDKLLMFEAGTATASAPQGALQSGEEALANFGATEVADSIAQDGATPPPSVPQAGITTEL